MESQDNKMELIPAEQTIRAVVRGEIDAQVSTAKHYPRNIPDFKKQAMELVTIDEETAGSMFYTLARGGKTIQGPSVRLAEVCAYSWGNLRVQSRVIEIGETHVTAVGQVFDSERNCAYSHEVKRRITDRSGRRYNDDMITIACNAACSIAYREAVFKAIPRAFVNSIYDAAMQTAIGNQETLTIRRARAVEWFLKAGIKEAALLKKLNRKDIEEITLDDLTLLTGLRTAIKDGEISLDNAFAEEIGAEKSQALGDKLKDKKKKLDEGGIWPTVNPPAAQTELL